MGYALVLGGAVVKLPQIVTVLRSKSAKGLNILSIELEVLATAVQSMYGKLARSAKIRWSRESSSYQLLTP